MTQTAAEKYRATKQRYMKQIAMKCDRMMPIMDDSGDEEMTIESAVDSNGNPTKKQKTKENDELESMFSNKESRFYNEVLKHDRSSMTDTEYVDWQIQQMKRFFNLDRGAKEAKAANLGDIKSTKIETPFILSFPLFDPKMS
jgi:hypothetical protein